MIGETMMKDILNFIEDKDWMSMTIACCILAAGVEMFMDFIWMMVF